MSTLALELRHLVKAENTPFFDIGIDSDVNERNIPMKKKKVNLEQQYAVDVMILHILYMCI